MLKSTYIYSIYLLCSILFVSCGDENKKSIDSEESGETVSTQDIPNLKPEVSENCTGDFGSVSDHVQTTFLKPIGQGIIVLRQTPKDSVLTFVQGEQSVEKNYDGIRFNGYITFEDDQLIQIRYDYIYECPSAKEKLSIDQNIMYETCVSHLGKELEFTGESFTRSYFWKINEQDLVLSYYDDGFSLVAKKETPIDTLLTSNQ